GPQARLLPRHPPVVGVREAGPARGDDAAGVRVPLGELRERLGYGHPRPRLDLARLPRRPAVVGVRDAAPDAHAGEEDAGERRLVERLALVVDLGPRLAPVERAAHGVEADEQGVGGEWEDVLIRPWGVRHLLPCIAAGREAVDPVGRSPERAVAVEGE